MIISIKKDSEVSLEQTINQIEWNLLYKRALRSIFEQLKNKVGLQPVLRACGNTPFGFQDSPSIGKSKFVKTWSNLGERIKGLKLWHFGKLNFTYHGKLRCHSGSSTVALQEMSRSRQEYFFALVYCGSSTAAITAFTPPMLQTSDFGR